MTTIADLLVNIIITLPLVGAYTMFALGIVFIYRASRVLNLAHGAMAMFPAFVSYSLASHVPVAIALGLAVVFGGVLGLSVEGLVVRRLRSSGPTSQTVGTVAVLGLLIAVAARFWGTTPLKAPSVLPQRVFYIGTGAISVASLGLFVVSLLVVCGFVALFRFTDVGLAMRAAADNRRAAALMGIDPDVTTAAAWAFAGALAALGGTLLAAAQVLHPYNLALQVLPAFVAALIGGLESVPGALYGSIAVGITTGIVPSLGQFFPPLRASFERPGAPQLALVAVAFLVMARRGERLSASDVRSGL